MLPIHCSRVNVVSTRRETIVIFTEEFTFYPLARFTTARTHITNNDAYDNDDDDDGDSDGTRNGTKTASTDTDQCILEH